MYTTLPKLIAAGHFMVDIICLIFPETGICSLCNKKKKKKNLLTWQVGQDSNPRDTPVITILPSHARLTQFE